MITIYNMDVMDGLAQLKDESVHCVITSPPYWNLRNYGIEGQVGLEETPQKYVDKITHIFREVRRVLRPDGTVWLNLGDSYAGSGKGIGSDHGKAVFSDEHIAKTDWKIAGLKPKDLVGMPWRVALALQNDGWWLRSDIIWAKPNPMPESATDRPTKSHEYIFLLTKSAKYFYDVDAVREPFNYPERKYNPDTSNHKTAKLKEQGNRTTATLHDGREHYGDPIKGRNLRDVWTISTRNYPGAHYATFPPKIPEICIKAGTSEKGCCPACGMPWKRILSKGLTDHSGETESDYEKGSNANRLAKLRQAAREQGDEYVNERVTVGWQPRCECEEHKFIGGNDEPQWTPWMEPYDPAPCIVLDPFNGHGTSGLVATRLGRNYIGIEINPEDCEATKRRIEDDAPLFNQVEIKK